MKFLLKKSFIIGFIIGLISSGTLFWILGHQYSLSSESAMAVSAFIAMPAAFLYFPIIALLGPLFAGHSTSSVLVNCGSFSNCMSGPSPKEQAIQVVVLLVVSILYGLIFLAIGALIKRFKNRKFKASTGV